MLGQKINSPVGKNDWTKCITGIVLNQSELTQNWLSTDLDTIGNDENTERLIFLRLWKVLHRLFGH